MAITNHIKDATLHKVIICRGIPDITRTGYWYDMEQSRVWSQEGIAQGIETTVRMQRMTYMEDGSMQEKSVDIDCALQFIEDIRSDDSDITVLCTHDVDFRPALELASTMGDGRQAVWSDGHYMNFKPLDYDGFKESGVIMLDHDDWKSCIDHTDWSYALEDMPDTRTHYKRMMDEPNNRKNVRMEAIRNILSDDES
jgi:hypothetical protein